MGMMFKTFWVLLTIGWLAIVTIAVLFSPDVAKSAGERPELIWITWAFMSFFPPALVYTIGAGLARLIGGKS